MRETTADLRVRHAENGELWEASLWCAANFDELVIGYDADRREALLEAKRQIESALVQVNRELDVYAVGAEWTPLVDHGEQ